MAQREIASRVTTVTIGTPVSTEEKDFDYCGYECPYFEYAFYGDSEYKTDYKTLLEENDDPNGSVTFYLVKDGVETELDSNAYGTPYEFGTVDGFPSYAGYEINWTNVATLLGNGDYHIKTVVNFFSVDTEKTTHTFKVRPFDTELADKTVKVESVQNGCIENGFDYTDLNWRRMCRIPGILLRTEPVETQENYLAIDRSIKQIQDRIHDAYTLSTDPIPEGISNLLLRDMFLGNTIKLTDYNIFNGTDIRSREVIKVQGSTPTELDQDTKTPWEFKFEDKIQDTVKRN